MKYIFALLIMLTVDCYIFSDENKNIFEVREGFCHNDKNKFSNGILVGTINNKLYSLSDGELVFYNKKRKDGIDYRNTSVAVIENKDDKKRFFYRIENYFPVFSKEVYKKNDELAAFQSNLSNNIYIQIEDLKNNKMINPLGLLDISDDKKPFIDDIYFITADNEKISLVKSYVSGINRGGKIYIKCFDRVNNSFFNVTPYKIRLLIDGKELANMVFNALDKSANSYKLGDKNFEEIYKSDESFNYYLADYNGLPGVIGFILEIEDIKGNKTEYKRALKIKFPENKL